MAEQHVNMTVTPVLHGRSVVDATPVVMVEAQFTPSSKRFTFEKHHNCKICTFTYPESKMVEVNGAWYCTKYKHDLEAI
jgi:hypothetical protein